METDQVRVAAGAGQRPEGGPGPEPRPGAVRDRAGLPVGDYAGITLPVGFPDALATALEAVIVAGAVVLLVRGHGPVRALARSPRVAVAAAVVAAALTLAGVLAQAATAKTHVSRAMVKLGARNRAQLVVIAYESGLVQPGWHGASPRVGLARRQGNPPDDPPWCPRARQRAQDNRGARPRPRSARRLRLPKRSGHPRHLSRPGTLNPRRADNPVRHRIGHAAATP